MKICNICGSEVDEALSFCPVCGSSFEFNKSENAKDGESSENVGNSGNQDSVNVYDNEMDMNKKNNNAADFNGDISVNKPGNAPAKNKSMLYVIIALIVAAIVGVGGYFLYTEVISSNSKSSATSQDEPGTDEIDNKNNKGTNDKKSNKKVGDNSENDSVLTDEAVADFLSEYAKALEDQDVKRTVEMTVIGAFDSKQIEEFSGKGYYEALSEFETNFRDVYDNYEELYGTGYKCTIEVKSISKVTDTELKEVSEMFNDVLKIDNAVKAKCKTKFNKKTINETLILVEIDGKIYLTA